MQEIGPTSFTKALALSTLTLAIPGACAPAPTVSTEAQALTHQVLQDPVSNVRLSITNPPTKNSEACPNTVLIGRSYSGTCPDVMPGDENWQKTELFGTSAPTKLLPYCRYEWQGDGLPEPSDLATLPSEYGREWSQWLDPDCQVVATFGHPMNDLMAPKMESAFRSQIDSLTSIPAGSSPPTRVRIEVIDTGDTQRGWPGLPILSPSRHAYEVATLAREVACPRNPSRACERAEIAHTLALRYPNPSPTDTNNYYGSQSHLALAIYHAVSAWSSSPAGNRPLVVNLSVGWSEAFGGPFTHVQHLDAPVRAVFDAINYAVCSGALVVAAAGNATGGFIPESGPVYPAAWEQKPVPTPAQCHGFVRRGAKPSTHGNYRPLLYSVGGVDGRDQSLAVSRPAGQPRLVAPGAHATVTDRYGDPLSALTGTSVSTAVISGTAALIWSLNPNLQPAEVMQRIYDSAVPLSPTADYCLGSTCGSTRRVSVCNAYVATCGQGGLNTCGEITAPCSSHPAGTDLRPNVTNLDAVRSYNYTFISPNTFRASTYVSLACKADVQTKHGISRFFPQLLCPAEQRYAATHVPYVATQPNVPVCSKCSFEGTNFMVGINEDLPDPIEQPTLSVVFGDNSVDTIDLSGEVTQMQPGDTWEIGGVIDVSLVHDVRKVVFHGMLSNDLMFEEEVVTYR